MKDNLIEMFSHNLMIKKLIAQNVNKIYFTNDQTTNSDKKYQHIFKILEILNCFYVNQKENDSVNCKMQQSLTILCKLQTINICY